VGLGRLELPTYGLGIQRAVLMGVENFWLYMRCQPLTQTTCWLVLIRFARFWAENYDTFMTLDFQSSET